MYAHWEGFVKTASTAYLEFVFYQRLKNHELAPNFLALSIRKLLQAASQTNKIESHIELAKFVLNELDTLITRPSYCRKLWI